MQTREERAKALADKQKQENKQVEQIDKLLSTFLKDFRSSKIKIDHEYRLSDEIALKELKTAIKEIKIPKEVEVTYKNTANDTLTHKFLWLYFSFSTVFLSLSIGLVFYSIKNEKEVLNELKTSYRNGIKEGQNRVYKQLPKSSQNFLKKKFPTAFE